MYYLNTLSKLVSAHGLYQRIPVTATDADTVRLDLSVRSRMLSRSLPG